MDAPRQCRNIVDSAVLLPPYSAKRASAVSTRVLHPMSGDRVHRGACTFYCKSHNRSSNELRHMSLINVRFYSYNTIKTFIQDGNSTMPLGPTMHMLAAAESGALTLLLTNPIWVVKTRLCLQCDSGSSAEYRGMVHALAEIYRTEGIRGLYRGFVPGMLGVSHGAIQFMTYEEMKNAYNEYRKLPIDTKLVCMSYILIT